MGRSSLLAPGPVGDSGADVGAAPAQWGCGGSVPTPQLLCVPAPPAGGQPGGFPPASCFTVSRASPPKAPQLFCLPPSPAGVLGAYLPSSPPRAAEIPRVPRDPLCSASLWPRGAALAGCGGPCSLAPGWEFRKNWFGKTRCLHASTSQAGAASPEACNVASSRVSRTHTGRAPRNGGDALSTESWQMRLTRTGVSPLG